MDAYMHIQVEEDFWHQQLLSGGSLVRAIIRYTLFL